MGQYIRPTQSFHHVAVIAYDEPFNPPEWVAEEFGNAGIKFSIINCQTEEDLINFAPSQEILLTSSARSLLTGNVIQHLTICRALVRIGSGVDCIDIPAATLKGIPVFNTPDAMAEEVSDHTAALLLDCARNISLQDRLVRQGLWRFAAMPPWKRLRGTTLGFVGFGRIARLLSRKLIGFEMNYLAYDPLVPASVAEQWGVKMTDMATLLKEADFITLHLPLTDETHYMLGEAELSSMKPTAYLINTARGAIVNQAALYKALSEGRIAGAALDVLNQEPPSPDDPMLKLKNVTFTPHSAASSDEVMEAMYRAAQRVVMELLAGRLPENPINPEVKPWWQTGPENG